MAVVATDLEGTLSTGETWKAVGKYLKQSGRSLRYRLFFARYFPGALLALVGVTDKRAYQSVWMRGLAGVMRGMSEAEIQEMAEWVVQQYLWPQRREGLLGELKEYHDRGFRVIITSGSFLPVVQAFAHRAGMEAVGSAIEMVGGVASGRMTGPMNVGAQKVAGLRERIGAEPLAAAYGDSLADLGMLEMSDRPVAIYPDKDLERLARERGWRIIQGEEQ